MKRLSEVEAADKALTELQLAARSQADQDRLVAVRAGLQALERRAISVKKAVRRALGVASNEVTDDAPRRRTRA